MYKILIVEDDMVIASSVKDYLRTWGMETSVVTDFEKVMENFIAFDPQLVLMDITLPFFNGYHWCQEIRKISDRKSTRLNSSHSDRSRMPSSA